jgi:hypothetical protein
MRSKLTKTWDYKRVHQNVVNRTVIIKQDMLFVLLAEQDKIRAGTHACIRRVRANPKPSPGVQSVRGFGRLVISLHPD